MREFLAEFMEKGRHNRKVLLFIVYVALFLDNMLLTTVVPIMPEYLNELEQPNSTVKKIGDRQEPPSASFLTTTARYGYELYESGRALFGQDVDDDNASDGRPSSSTGSDDYPVTSPGPSARSAGSSGSEVNSSSSTATTVDPLELEYAKRNVWVGLMFGSKAMIQLLTNPFVGPLTNRIGYTIPMFSGFVIMFISTLVFAFGRSYGVLFFARALQGVGSACTSSSGMGMLAQVYPDDSERGSAMGIALGGLALGVLVGPPFGGFLFQVSGKELPFILLALMALFEGALQLMVLQPKFSRGEQEGTSLKTLIKDPFIDLAAGAITIGNLGIAMLEPSLPIWMMKTMNADPFTTGVAFLPASVSYMIGTNIFGPLAHRIGRWLSAMTGLIIIGCSLIAIPSAKSVYGLIAPNGFMGFAIGMIDASMFPQMGYLVDLRHVGVYGSVYAIADAAFCFAFTLGPFFSGPIVRYLDFAKMMYIIAAINFIFAPFMYLLRNPPAIASEKEHLISNGHESHFRYEKFSDSVDGMTLLNKQQSVDRAEYEYDY